MRHQTVRVEGVPVGLFLESQDQQHDLIRELQLIELDERLADETAAVSKEVAALISDILTRYAQVRSVTRDQALAALDRGDETVDLEVPVVPGMVEALQEWLRLLGVADELCHEGSLLVLASRPEIRQLREWYVAGISRRLAHNG